MNSDQTKAELIELLNQSREHTRFLKELGVETIALSSAVAAKQSIVIPPNGSSATPSPPQPQAIPQPRRFETARPEVAAAATSRPQDSLFGDATPPQSSLAASSETLEEIWRDIGDCTRCGLCEGRTQVVNTHGYHKARLMFVGEAPGADEDAQGKPFVGRAGQLLTKMIEAMGMKREDVIIGNVNRCRPPGNRQPTLEEAAICRPFLFREIAAIRPEVIVVMGNTALRNLLEVREGISRVRGKFRDFRGIKVMPTFHPAYLLRDPSKKRETWEDLKMVRDFLEGKASRQD